jgi:SanA protein
VKNKLKKTSLALIALLLLGMLAISILDHKIKQSTKALTYTTIHDLPDVHTAIVLGASVRSNGELSVMLRDRVETALFLYNEGKVKRFLLSGDNSAKNYNEPLAMKKYLTERGVPQDHIYLDYAGFDTYDTMYRSKAVFQVESAVIVTQGFHLPRAIYIAQNMNLDYTGFCRDTRSYAHQNYNAKRELLANVKAYLELVFRKEPTYLGSKIPITGPPQSSY